VLVDVRARRWTTSSDKWAQPRATWPRPRQRLQGAARRRRVCLAGGIAVLLLVGVAVAVVVALVLVRSGRGGA